MPTDSQQYSSAWTVLSLVILFAMVPGVLFLLGKAASAGTHPEPEQMDEVRELAVVLNQSTEQLLTEGTHAFQSAPGERKALDTLIRLAETAEEFRAKVLSENRSPSSTGRAFYQLLYDFERAREVFPAFRTFRNGKERFEQIRRAMEELKFYYVAQSQDRNAVSGRPNKAPPFRKSPNTNSLHRDL